MDIVLVRHGSRRDWVNRRVWQEQADQHAVPWDASDSPLSEPGLQQAKELAAFVARQYGGRIKHVFSSPMYRCLQTATAVAQALGLQVKVEHGLQEWPPGKPQPVESLLHLLPPGTIDLSYRTLLEVEPGSDETVDEMHERGKRFAARLLQYLDSLPQEEKGGVLLASHAAGVISVTRALLGDRHARVNCGVCSLTQLHSELAPRQWKLVEDGRTDFLESGNCFDWSFEDGFRNQSPPPHVSTPSS
eukprot:TRINITY_DN7314_c0_g1_i2.p1 TRINITY_DN7314_c0_g1~~TRINITY_DN7314_c0_g1_i2.p1  ORF type:complete len:260 (+),score=71.84 TRINITY_DN7314_c0_g1_i2:43-780(+)